jgi:hypothetical protein
VCRDHGDAPGRRFVRYGSGRTNLGRSKLCSSARTGRYRRPQQASPREKHRLPGGPKGRPRVPQIHVRPFRRVRRGGLPLALHVDEPARFRIGAALCGRTAVDEHHLGRLSLHAGDRRSQSRRSVRRDRPGRGRRGRSRLHRSGGGAFRVPAAGTRCSVSRETGAANLICAHTPKARYSVVLLQGQPVRLSERQSGYPGLLRTRDRRRRESGDPTGDLRRPRRERTSTTAGDHPDPRLLDLG